MVFLLVRRSREVVPEELVTLISWDPRYFLICLVIVGTCGLELYDELFGGAFVRVL